MHARNTRVSLRLSDGEWTAIFGGLLVNLGDAQSVRERVWPYRMIPMRIYLAVYKANHTAGA